MCEKRDKKSLSFPSLSRVQFSSLVLWFWFSYGSEGLMGFWWQVDADLVSRPHDSFLQDHSHDASLADEPALLITSQQLLQEALLKVFQLGTRIAQASHLDQCCIAQMQQRACWQTQKIDATRGDVLAYLASKDLEASEAQLVMQLGVD